MRHDQPYLGKFEGNDSRRLSEALYNLAGNGLNEELGDVQAFGWYGKVQRRKHGYIVFEDSQGFFGYQKYPTLKTLEQAWAKLLEKYESLVLGRR